MSDIPSEIVRKILLHISAETLLRFRAVCKAWCRIIDDKSFIKAHTKIQHPPTTVLIRNSIGSRIFSVSLDSLDFDNGRKTIEAVPVKALIRRGVPRVYELPVASCNGLILICDRCEAKKTWVIWNRLTREFHELPKLDTTDIYVIGVGFGYDSRADDYKVVRIAGPNEICWKTYVYSLKSGCWKMVKHNQPGDLYVSGTGVFLDGSLYWKLKDMIIAFDLDTENYSQLPLPRLTKEPCEPGDGFYIYLDAIGGCLVFSHYYKEHWGYKDRLDGWVMGNGDGEKSWTKLFSFGNRGTYCINRVPFRPIAYLKSKGQILLQHDRRFFWLDIEKNSAKKVSVGGLPYNFDRFTSQVCPGSLFRLDQSYDVKRRVATKRRRRRRVPKKSANQSLKVFVKRADFEHSSESDMWNYGNGSSDSSLLSLDEECISDSMDP